MGDGVRWLALALAAKRRRDARMSARLGSGPRPFGRCRSAPVTARVASCESQDDDRTAYMKAPERIIDRCASDDGKVVEFTAELRLR